MNKESIKQYLREKTSYAKKGTGWMYDYLTEKDYKIDFTELREALREIRFESKPKNNFKKKTLIYDLEVTLLQSYQWWSGNSYINGNTFKEEQKIITVAYMWAGDDKVKVIEWDNNKKCDKNLILEFVKLVKKSDELLGFNNIAFDDKILFSRALKHNIDYNPYIKSYDVMKMVKSKLRLPSYSMKYISKYLGFDSKLKTDIDLWKRIQWGNKKDSRDALNYMKKYNIQDIILTNLIYEKIKKNMHHVVNVSVAASGHKWACPNTGSINVEYYKTTYTKAGTIQHLMKCNKCGIKYKVSNREYIKFLNK